MQSVESSRVESWLSWFFKGLLILVSLILFGRMFELQIIKGAYYRELSENQEYENPGYCSFGFWNYCASIFCKYGGVYADFFYRAFCLDASIPVFSFFQDSPTEQF